MFQERKTLKKLLIFQGVTWKAWKSKKNYEEAKFSKLKYFFIIITKHFFSFYNIFSILKKYLFFIFWEILRVTLITLLRLFFSLKRFSYISRAFLYSLSLFSWHYLADKVLKICIYTKIIYINIYEKLDLKNSLQISTLLWFT